MKYFAILALFPFVAFATDNKPPAVPSQVQGQQQGQVQAQEQSQAQAQSQIASANNAGNSQSMNFDDRSVALGQGSIYIPDCAAGGNAGGGDNGAVGFLGFAYIPAWCQDFMLAKFLFSAGEYEAGCAVMAASKPGKRAAKKGIVLPKCAKPVPVKPLDPVPVPVVVNVSEDCASKEYVSEAVSKGFEHCVSK